MAVGNVVLVALLCLMAASAPYAVDGVVTCDLVVNSLTPCASYLMNGGAVPPKCCDGIKSLYTAAKTTTDRQTACNCMENIAKRFPGYSLGPATALPGKCGVNIPYKISPNTDCSKVH